MVISFCAAIGHAVLINELEIGDDGTLLGPDHLLVREMQQRNKTFNLKTYDFAGRLQWICSLIQVYNAGVRKHVMHVGRVSIPRIDVSMGRDGIFCSHGKEMRTNHCRLLSGNQLWRMI